MNTQTEEQRLVEIAHRVLPAGNIGNLDSDMIIAEGRGGRVRDINGNWYVDFLLGSGPMMIGHGNPEIAAAVAEQIGRGTTFFANNPWAIELAEEIVKAVPCADQVRFANSGTEVDFLAMRAARAYTGKTKILKFEGGYHGMSDYTLISLWSTSVGNTTRGQPDSAGIPQSVQDEILVAPYNDLTAAEQIIREHKDELAGVIVEPMQRLYMPLPGFLEGLRALTEELGIVLIFDEVVTGFRMAYGGAQEYFGVVPDLCTLGKIVGGGFPLAAIAGKAEIMAHFDKKKVGPKGYLPFVGTLNANPIASIAGLTSLRILQRPGTYEKLNATGNTIRAALDQHMRAAGVPAVTSGFPGMFDIYFTSLEQVRNFRESKNVNAAITAKFSSLLQARGILRAGKFYISLAHNEEDVEQTVNAIKEAAPVLAEQLEAA